MFFCIKTQTDPLVRNSLSSIAASMSSSVIYSYDHSTQLLYSDSRNLQLLMIPAVYSYEPLFSLNFGTWRHEVPCNNLIYSGFTQLRKVGENRCWLGLVLHLEISKLSKYLSTLSKLQSSFTTGMMAGTSRSKWDGEEGPESEDWGCFLAALIASLVAQCTEAARSKGGSPDAATKDSS